MLSKVTTQAKSLPPRIVMYAAEKFGKSSFAAHSWNPVFLMTSGETGLIPLIESGRVPPVAHFPDDFTRWSDFTRAVVELRDDPHDFRTLVIDTGNGAEQLCAASVCEDSFGGTWADYAAYGRGNELASKEWAKFLGLLDQVRVRRRMAVIVLHHAKVKTFQDPAGKDWDQWRPEAIDKLWSLTHKWADCILFGGFRVTVNRDDKATGEQRFLRSEASAAMVAGNRYGLPPELTAAPGAANLWAAFANAIGKAKATRQAPTPAATVTEPPTPEPAPEPKDTPDAAPDHPAVCEFYAGAFKSCSSRKGYLEICTNVARDVKEGRLAESDRNYLRPFAAACSAKYPAEEVAAEGVPQG